jgi:hypothetical protein
VGASPRPRAAVFDLLRDDSDSRVTVMTENSACDLAVADLDVDRVDEHHG